MGTAIMPCMDMYSRGTFKTDNPSKNLTLLHFLYDQPRGLVSESLTTNHEVPGSIPGSTVGILTEGEDSRGDHGLGRLVEFRFKGPPDTTSSYITTHIIGTT